MNSKYNEEKNKDLDQGWAWVIMVAACVAGIINGLLIYGAGVVHVALLQRFEEDNAYTALIGSIFTSLLSLIGPLASMLINIYSCRMTMIVGGIVMFIGFVSSFFASHNLNYILITYGIIAGTGLGLCATPPLVVIGYFFHLKRGLALAVVVSGAGFGMFIAGPILQALINQYGLPGAFLVLGAISSNQIVIGSLMRPSDLENKHKMDVKRKRDIDMLTSKSNNNISYNLKNLLHLDILSDKSFMFCSLQYLLWNVPFSILLLHLTNYAVLQGSSKENAALLITYIGISSVFGRIITGLSVGHNGLDPVMLNFGFNGIVGLLTILFPLYSGTFQGQTVFTILFGLYSGGLATMINPLCMELIGVSKLSSGIGTMYFIGGVGYIIGPPIAGFLVDNGGTYEDSFILCGVLFLLAAVFTLILNNWRIQTKEAVVLSLENLKDPSLSIWNDELHPDVDITIDIFPNHICHSKEIISENSDVADKNPDVNSHIQDSVEIKLLYEKSRHNLGNGHKAVEIPSYTSDNGHILQQDHITDESTPITAQCI
ncbi:monocarboxylate transporter 12-like [Mytilus trossulus]|uniref:monocarboxylate transporter 12-like n=1 Tax=Mytilus trossulus TaxID=6551 RepID=UPI0030068E08